jgi:ribosomal protein S18 acetylase RimI-like enzyme
VFVAEIDGDATGYVTCHLDRASNQGSIGLIAVSGQTREKGLGRELVLTALGWCCRHGSSEVSVVTQGANVAAQRLFQRCGFRTYSMGLWFHRWTER